MKKFLLVVLFPVTLLCQTQFEYNLDSAYVNAKKGIYYGLSNIPDRKSSLSSDLVDHDKLIASIKVSKEVNGVRIESEGFFDSYSVKVVAYRSYESLKAEGIIRYIPEE